MAFIQCFANNAYLLLLQLILLPIYYQYFINISIDTNIIVLTLILLSILISVIKIATVTKDMANKICG